jgi:predicted Zn finger-like uncharacterized protein
MPEIVSCPQCQRQLRVPDELLGHSVKCPSCGTTFTGATATATAPSPPPAPPVYTFAEDQPAPAQYPKPEFDDYRGPRRSEPPLLRRDAAPHRGTLILVFGILSLVVCGFFGPVAWILGNNDLAEMRAGRMDREGEGMTQAGRICGMIASILMIAGCLCYGMIFLMMAAGGAAGG